MSMSLEAFLSLQAIVKTLRWAALICLAGGCASKEPESQPIGQRAEPFVSTAWSELSGVAEGVALTRNGSTIELWGSNNGRLRRGTYTVTGGFSGWTELAGAPGDGIAGAPAAVNYAGNVAIIAKDESKRVWWRVWMRASNDFSGPWSAVGGTSGVANGSPAATVPPSEPTPSKLFVWIRGTNGKLGVSRYTPETSSWSAWSYDMDAPAVGFTNSPAAVAIAGKTMFSHQHEIIVLGGDGQLWRRPYSTSAGPSSTWLPLGGSFVGSPTALASPDRGLEILARKSNGDVYFIKGFLRASLPGLDFTDWSRLHGPPPGGFATGVFPAYAGHYAGSTHASGLVVFALEADGKTVHSRRIEPGAPSDTSLGSSDQKLFEDTTTVIPPGVSSACSARGYPNGAVFLLPGNQGDPEVISRYDADCVRRQRPVCERSSSVQAATWPESSVLRSNYGLDSQSEKDHTIFDNYLIADGSGGLTLTRQFVARRTDGSYAGRGAQGIFRSTDCGQTWQFQKVLDPLSFYGGAYARRVGTDCTGFDRPEMLYEPAKNRIYLTANACGDGGDAQVLFWSSVGPGPMTTWNPVETNGISPFIRTSGVLAAAPDGVVFLFGTDGGAPVLEAYNPNTSGVHTNGRIPGVLPCDGCEATHPDLMLPSRAMASAGMDAQTGEYLLRVAFPRTEGVIGYQVQRVMALRVRLLPRSALSIAVLTDQTIRASKPEGSVLMFTMLSAPASALPSGKAAQLMYWDETTRTGELYSATADFGVTQAKAYLARGVDPIDLNTRITLSNQWPPEAWPGFQLPGDYRRGTVYWNQTSGVTFLPMWVRYPTFQPNDLAVDGRTKMAAVFVTQ